LVVVIIVAVSSGGSDDDNGNGSISIRSVSPPATSSAGRLRRREVTPQRLVRPTATARVVATPTLKPRPTATPFVNLENSSTFYPTDWHYPYPDIPSASRFFATAKRYQGNGRNDLALWGYTQAIQISWGGASSLNEPTLVVAYYNRSIAYRALGLTAKADADADLAEACKSLERLPDYVFEDHWRLPEALEDRGSWNC